MKKPKYELTFLIFFLSITYSADLSLILSSEKTEFLLDETILIEVTETNNTSEVINTNRLSFLSENYIIILTSNPPYQFSRYVFAGSYSVGKKPAMGLDLLPGESQYIYLHLNSLIGLVDDEKNRGYGFYYLPIGDYTLKLIHYTNPNWKYYQIIGDNNAIVDKKPIESNEIEFSIIEPGGSQVDQRMQYLNTISDYYSIKDQQLRAGVIEKYIEKYPNSVYTLDLYKYYCYLYPEVIPSSENTIKAFNVINKYKSSVSIDYLYLYQLSLYDDLDIRNFSDRTEFKKLLNERIQIDYPNTKLSKYIKNRVFLSDN